MASIAQIKTPVFRSIVSETRSAVKKETQQESVGNEYRVEYNMVVFTPEQLGPEAVERLAQALRRYIRARESFSGERFYRSGRKRGFRVSSNSEVDEVVAAEERDAPFWDVRVRKETYRGSGVEVEILAAYNTRPGQPGLDNQGSKVDQWSRKVSRLPASEYE